MNTKSAAKFLGWFGVALGAAELVAAGPICNALGLKSRWLVRLFGLREIASGAGILAAPELSGVGLDKLSPWLWARVAGDALDTAVLASALKAKNPKRSNVLLTILLVSPIIALDLWCAPKLSSEEQ